MKATPNNVREIFIAALKLTPEQRPTYLDEACGTDEILRDRVQKRKKCEQAKAPPQSVAQP